jgi:sugar phosphate isomerase/epimerase
MFYKKLIILVIASLINFDCEGQNQKDNLGSVFEKENLIAWCIVPYDSQKRTPKERVEMLKDLGINKLAYDWRDEHIPSFDEELETLENQDIKLQGFWLYSGSDPAEDKKLEIILNLFKRQKTKTQLWAMFEGWPNFDKLTQTEKVKVASESVGYVAKKLDEIGCSLGLYNHGGWFGEPENQLAIIEHLKMKNIGIVYNFSHAETQIHRFPEFYPKILPYLYAINVTGLQGGYPAKVVPIGEGNIEKEMIQIIQASSYQGPIGIINEDFAEDAKDGLQMNMDGLKTILESLGYKKTVATYD